MSPNDRVDIYAAVQKALRRRLTPGERAALDRLLDGFGLGRRF
jgi:hypothetical protein